MKELISIMFGFVTYLNTERIFAWFGLGIVGMVVFVLIYKQTVPEREIPWIKCIILCANLAMVIVVTLVGRVREPIGVWKMWPFWSYVEVIKTQNTFLLAQILWNILLFVPIGFLLPKCFRRFERYVYIISAIFLLSLLIEIVQGVFRIGWFELDDIINNILGGVIGCWVHAKTKINVK